MGNGHKNRAGRGAGNQRARHGPARLVSRLVPTQAAQTMPLMPGAAQGAEPAPLYAEPAATDREEAAMPSAPDAPQQQLDGGGSQAASSAPASRTSRFEHFSRLNPPGILFAQPSSEETPEESDEPAFPRQDVRGEVGTLIDALHERFEQDRAVAVSGGSTRCGICYFHFPLAELEYREQEGFYVCGACRRALGNMSVPMVRRQQR